MAAVVAFAATACKRHDAVATSMSPSAVASASAAPVASASVDVLPSASVPPIASVAADAATERKTAIREASQSGMIGLLTMGSPPDLDAGLAIGGGAGRELPRQREYTPSRGRAPVVRLDRVAVTGRASETDVKRVLSTRLSVFEHCYAAGRRDNPLLEGEVILRFDIDETGKPTAVRADGSAMEQAVVSCVLAAVRQLRFPAVEASARATIVMRSYAL